MFDGAFVISNTKLNQTVTNNKRSSSSAGLKWRNSDYHHPSSPNKRRRGGRRRRRRQYGNMDDIPVASTPSSPRLWKMLEERQLGREKSAGRFARRSALIKRVSQPFSALKTPSSEAVLGINGDGTQFYSLATNGFDGLKLLIRGLSLNRSHHPVLQQITLETQSPLNDASPVATIPVDILMTADWNLGIARILSLQQKDLGTLVLIHPNQSAFQQPQATGGVLATARNMHVGSRLDHPQGKVTLRNHLWNCPRGVPILQQGTVRRRIGPGYLFLNDEDDGYRLTWLQPPSQTTTILQDIPNETIDASTKSSDILSFQEEESVWDGDTSWITAEAYLQVDALLDHIRSRRKHVFAYNELRSPDFFYNIVDFNGDSLLTLLLVFGNRSPKTKHLSSIGVFIKINLFTGTYKEQKWIQNQQTPESKQLQLWCYQLAILQRIQGIGTSPKLGATNLQNVVHELTEANRVAGGERSLSRGDDDGSLLSYADLYPDCDILSNFPVRTGLPVKTLTCRSGTTQFTYN